MTQKEYCNRINRTCKKISTILIEENFDIGEVRDFIQDVLPRYIRRNTDKVALPTCDCDYYNESDYSTEDKQ